jgi:hypothetical protein
MNHDGEGAERNDSRQSMGKTRGIMMDQVQNEENHEEAGENKENHEQAGAKQDDSRRRRCKTREITMDQVQNEGNHDEVGVK